MFLFFFFFFQRVLVAGFQSKLSWSLLSCYCGHCWLLPRLLFVAAPSAALVLLQRPWLLQWVLILATSAGASFGCLCGALFLLLLWALLSAASTGALSCLLLRMLLRWLLLRLLFSRDCFCCCRYFSLLLMLFLVKVRRRAGLLSSRLPGNLTMLFLMP